MKKVILSILLSIFILIQAPIANTEAVEYVPFYVVEISDSNYKLEISTFNPVDLSEETIIGRVLKNFHLYTSMRHNGKGIDGTATWDNPDYIIVAGEQTVGLTYKRDDTGEIIKAKAYIYGKEDPSTVPTPTLAPIVQEFFDMHEEKQNTKPDEPTAPSLTATSVSLDKPLTYDINLNNKQSGASYEWTSSDTDIVDVNHKNGKLKAKGVGTAIVTCQITNKDGTTHTLQSEITVGYDDNAPLLTETSLDLETGNVFDINLENKVAKSKYRWASSDKSVIVVNSSNGKVKAVAPGEAYVTCAITTPEKQVIVLRCDINVTAPEEVTE